MNTGQIIRMTNDRIPYWRQGDRAKLVRQDGDGDWWADFTFKYPLARVKLQGLWDLAMGVK